jgi:hypothetical protein
VVKVSVADGIRAKGGANVLTSGGKFTGANVSLASGGPKWAKEVAVDEQGDIVLAVSLKSVMILIR